MKINRRTFVAWGSAIGSTTSLLSPPQASAASFPTKTITLIVPFSPGGNVDVSARTIAGPLGKLLGQSVLVENRAGASGGIAAAAVALSAPDGYTLLVGNPGQVVTVPLLIKMSYTPASFKPVGLVNKTSVVLIGRKQNAHFKNFEEFRAYANANPGVVTAANPGQGTPNHLGILQLEKALKLKFNTISYRGSAPALTDLMGGHIDVCFDQITSSLPYIKSGALQPLAILGPSQDPALPDVRTLDQLGVSGIDATTYVGVFAPAGIPTEVLNTLAAALREVVQAPNVITNLGALGSQAYAGSANELGRILERETAMAEQLIKEGRLTA